MGNTCFLFVIALCGIVRCASANLSLSPQHTDITVAVADEDTGTFEDVTSTVITMFMHSRLTRVFKVSMLCTEPTGEVCVEFESSADTGSIVKLEDTPEICCLCDATTMSFANSDMALSISHSRQANSTAVLENNSSNPNNGVYVTETVNLTFVSELIGVTMIRFKSVNVTGDAIAAVSGGDVSVRIKVVRTASSLDLVFLVCVYFIEIFEMLVFGTQLDFATLKKTFRRPMIPLIGFVCQYVGMPLAAFCIAKGNTGESLASLGIFVAGICPGGGGSNIYSYLLGGDLSLSITMTTISTIMSLAMMPLWLYTLGQEFLDKDTADIPFIDIVVALSIILVPLTVGLLIQHKFPKAQKRIDHILTAVITVVAIVLIVTGIYANLYIFQLMTIKIVLIGCALPYLGLLVGGTVSLLLGLPADIVKTIAIETGMQNTGVGYILLYNSLSEPYSDIACVAPVSSEIISPIPSLIIAIVYIIHKKCYRKYDTVSQKTETDAPSDEGKESESFSQGRTFCGEMIDKNEMEDNGINHQVV